jgi:hypothetical protein
MQVKMGDNQTTPQSGSSWCSAPVASSDVCSATGDSDGSQHCFVLGGGDDLTRYVGNGGLPARLSARRRRRPLLLRRQRRPPAQLRAPRRRRPHPLRRRWRSPRAAPYARRRRGPPPLRRQRWPPSMSPFPAETGASRAAPCLAATRGLLLLSPLLALVLVGCH